MSAVTPSPVTGDPDGARGHRLDGNQALTIAAVVPRLTEFHETTRQLAVRAVDRGSEWVRSFLTPSERASILAAIEELAPRLAAPAHWKPLGDVLTTKKSEGDAR